MKPIIAVLVMGVIGIGSQAFAQIACPAPINEESCEAMDYTCLGRNTSLRNKYNYEMSVCRAGAQNQNATSTGIPVPTQPVMENCSASGTTDASCVTRNQVANQNYQTSLANYNLIKQKEAEAQKALEQQQYNSAMEAARAAQSANKQGSDKYALASALCTVASVALIPPCSAPGGQGACIASAAFAAFSILGGQQAGSHDDVKYDACTAANQISTSPTGCGAKPTPFIPSNWPSNTTAPLTNNFDPNGNCIGTPAQCQQIIDNLPPGTNIKGAMDAISKFASGKGPFKVNADGSITMKNGKTYKASDFDSEKAMIAAGMSPAQAASLMAELNKQKSLTDLDAKSALAKENESGEGGIAGGGAAVNGVDGMGNGDSSGLSKDAGGKRDIAAAEGLSKDFNGELIGVAGDDIFKMMNRRYKLKSTQDAFISFKP